MNKKWKIKFAFELSVSHLELIWNDHMMLLLIWSSIKYRRTKYVPSDALYE